MAKKQKSPEEEKKEKRTYTKVRLSLRLVKTSYQQYFEKRLPNNKNKNNNDQQS